MCRNKKSKFLNARDFTLNDCSKLFMYMYARVYNSWLMMQSERMDLYSHIKGFC